MKSLAFIFLSLMGCLNSFSQISNDSIVKVVAISGGLFYDNTVSLESLLPPNSSMVTLKDPEGKSVFGIYLPKGYVMEESLKEKAIPSERVKYAEKLLRDYNGRRPFPIAPGIGVTVGEPFVEFEYKDTEDNVWNNEKLKGKIFVINLWQTECGPCRREMPVLSEWKEKFPDVVFLSASRHNTEEIQPIADQHHFTWTHLQEAYDLIALVRQQGFPLTIVVDKDGIVRYAKVGASEENQAQAIAVIEELLRV